MEDQMLHLHNATLEDIAGRIKKEKLRIVVYGAGMIGKIVVPDMIERYYLSENIACYIDGDTRKQGKQIMVGGKPVTICSPKVLDSLLQNVFLFITNSNYSAVLAALDKNEHLNGMDAVIIPVIQALSVKERVNGSAIILRRYSEERIPKVIHYCWFSGKEMPDHLKKCVDSWHRFCPDYEIKRWDESNYDVSKNSYMKQAYEAKKWGFVPDYARLDILYNYGGFYLDTDVELIKSLDALRNQWGFCGVEKWGNINMGGCSGAVKQHPMIKKLLDYRENIPFIREDGTYNLETCCVYETKPFIEEGMTVDNTTQRIQDMTVFSSDYFHPYDYMSGETCITKNTYSIHHFNGGWLDEKKRGERKQTAEAYKKILKRMRV